MPGTALRPMASRTARTAALVASSPRRSTPMPSSTNSTCRMIHSPLPRLRGPQSGSPRGIEATAGGSRSALPHGHVLAGSLGGRARSPDDPREVLVLLRRALAGLEILLQAHEVVGPAGVDQGDAVAGLGEAAMRQGKDGVVAL